MQVIQTQEEVLRLFDEYGRGFAPPDFIQNEQNAKALLNYVLEKYGIVSISYLIEAEKTLGARLQRVKQPTPAEKAAADAKRWQAKMQRDYLDSIKPQKDDFQERLKAKQAAEARAKEQAEAEATIKLEIAGYLCNAGPGRVDFAKTEMLRDQLRQIEVCVNGKRDAVRTLAKVREALSNMP